MIREEGLGNWQYVLEWRNRGYLPFFEGLNNYKVDSVVRFGE